MRCWTRPPRGVIAALAHRADEVWREVSSTSLSPLGDPSRVVSIIREVNLRHRRACREGEEGEGVKEMRSRHKQRVVGELSYPRRRDRIRDRPKRGASEALQLQLEAH